MRKDALLVGRIYGDGDRTLQYGGRRGKGRLYLPKGNMTARELFGGACGKTG